MTTKKTEPVTKTPKDKVGELTDHTRNTEADTKQDEPLVDGSGNKVIGGVSVEE